MFFETIKTPHGPITLFAEDNSVIALEFGSIPQKKSTRLLKEATNQLKAYFKGRLKHFSLPLNASGTPFQEEVWDLILKIPYGTTQSYSDLAEKLNSAPRPVGMACGRNPIPIIIPCHRVLRANYKIGGFSAGFGSSTKKSLLLFEGITENICSF